MNLNRFGSARFGSGFDEQGPPARQAVIGLRLGRA